MGNNQKIKIQVKNVTSNRTFTKHSILFLLFTIIEFSVHPDVQTSYTRIYPKGTPGYTSFLHPGVDILLQATLLYNKHLL